ncbi:MAG: 50S ribosomal protein L9 [bacterium JZ-2024 1]
MKVILVEDVPSLGKAGDLVEVKDGYGRNYLIPRGLAVHATKKRIAFLERIQKELLQQKDRKKARALAIAEQLRGKTVTIPARAGREGKLFGAITSHHIAENIQKQLQVKIEPKMVDMDQPIRILGVHPIRLRLAEGIDTEIQLEVKEISRD